MSKALRTTLYIGLSALMVGSLGSGINTVTAPNANARRIHRVYRHKYHETSNHKFNDFRYNHKLDGHHAIFNHPSLLHNARVRFTRSNVRHAIANGVTFRITRAARVNHTHRYYKVESNDGIMSGWVLARSTRLVTAHHYKSHKIHAKKSHAKRAKNTTPIVNDLNDKAPKTNKRAEVTKHPKAVISTKDRRNYHKVSVSVDRAKLLADFSKINFSDHSVSENDSNHAERYLAGAKRHTNSIKNHALHNQAYKLVKGLENYMSNISHVKLNARNTQLTRLDHNVSGEISAADNYLAMVGRNPRQANATLYMQLANNELNHAESGNRRLIDSSAIKSNGIAIRNARNYQQRINRALNGHANTPKKSHSSSVSPTDADGIPKIVPNNDRNTVAHINSMYDAVKTQFSNILGRDRGNINAAEHDASIARNDLKNMKSMASQISDHNTRVLVSDKIGQLTKLA